MNALSVKLREFRLASDMTPDQIAQAVGLSTSGLLSFETGHRPAIETLQRIAAFYGVTYDELAALTDGKLQHKRAPKVVAVADDRFEYLRGFVRSELPLRHATDAAELLERYDAIKKTLIDIATVHSFNEDADLETYMRDEATECLFKFWPDWREHG